MPCLLFTFYHHIIDVYLNRSTNLIPEHFCHYPLISGPGIFQLEWHHGVVVVSIRGYKCRLLLILGGQGNMMIALKGVQKTHPRVPIYGIHQLIDLWHGKWVF